MRKLSVISLVIGAILLPGVSQAEMVFGVKPNLDVQSAFVGMSNGRITPYFGVDALWIGVKYKNQDVNWSTNYPSSNLYRSHVGTIDAEGSATLLMPRIGARMGLGTGDIKPYVFADLFMTFAFANVKGREVDRQYSPDGTPQSERVNDWGLGDEEDKAIEDLLGLYGFNLGFGAEYKIHERFGVGGEYALRMVRTSADYKTVDHQDYNNDGQDDWREEWQHELSATLQMTYAAVCLNFYF